MRIRITSLLLAMALLLGLGGYIAPEARAVQVPQDQIIDTVLEIFGYNEGTYDSVNCNDNGALSIGKLQWHGSRALALMKSIVAADSEAALATLGSSLYNEIVNASAYAWGSRTLTRDEAARFAVVLGSADGCRLQDALARSDIATYIDHGRDVGVKTASALVYYCDVENQYGQYGANSYIVNPIKNRTGKSTIDSLEEFHTNLLQVTGNYHSRRIWTYNFCRNLAWGDSGASNGVTVTPDTTAPVIDGLIITQRSRDSYTLQFAAPDDTGVCNCLVVSCSNASADDEMTQSAVASGGVWTATVPVSGFSANGTTFTSRLQVYDAAGNLATDEIRVTLGELYEAAGSLPLAHNCAVEGHEFAAAQTVAATCTADGYQLEQCSHCAMTRRTVAETALGHRYISQTVVADCENGGCMLYTCSICGAQMRTDEHEALGHSWSEWQQTQAPTATRDGVRKRTCETCGETETGVVAGAAHAHAFETQTVEATCQRAGAVYTCCACGEETVTPLELVKHNFQCAARTLPTQDDPGGELWTCRWCDASETREFTHYCDEFTDVSSNFWAAADICYAVETGLFQGVSQTAFAPQRYMTRAMLVVVLHRLAGTPEAGMAAAFEDVAADNWYAGAVAWAKANGIVNGVSETSFAPERNVTREQLAAILYRYAEWSGMDTRDGADLSGYPDAGRLNGYAIGPWMWAAESGLLKGMPSGNVTLLMPQANATRAQVAAILTRFAALTV